MPRYIGVGGSNTSPYDTWAKAATTLQTAITGASAGELFFVDSALVDTTAGSVNLTWPSGTKTNPCVLISVDRTGDPEPPAVTDYQRGARYGATSGANDTTLTDNECSAIFIGFEFEATDDISCSNSGVAMLFEDCGFTLNGSNGADKISFEGTANYFELRKCDFDFGHTGQELRVGGRSWHKFVDCAIKSGSAAITDLIGALSGEAQTIEIDGFDCTSAASSGFEVIGDTTISTTTAGECHQIWLNGIALPTGGIISSGAIADIGTKIEWRNCSVPGGSIAAQGARSAVGDVSEDTAIYLDSTYDGVNEYSLEFTCNSSSVPGGIGAYVLRYPLCEVWLDGTNKTITAHAHEGNATAARVDELWIEVTYPDATTAWRKRLASSNADEYMLGSTASAVATESDPGWTSGLSDKQFYAPSVTLTSEEGVAIVWGCVAFGASRTVYFSPGVTITP